jgi:hypothetical protein
VLPLSCHQSESKVLGNFKLESINSPWMEFCTTGNLINFVYNYN